MSCCAREYVNMYDVHTMLPGACLCEDGMYCSDVCFVSLNSL